MKSLWIKSIVYLESIYLFGLWLIQIKSYENFIAHINYKHGQKTYNLYLFWVHQIFKIRFPRYNPISCLITISKHLIWVFSCTESFRHKRFCLFNIYCYIYVYLFFDKCCHYYENVPYTHSSKNWKMIFDYHEIFHIEIIVSMFIEQIWWNCSNQIFSVDKVNYII